MREQRPRSPERFGRGGVYSVRDFVDSKFHSTGANDPANDPTNDPANDPAPEALATPRASGKVRAQHRIGRFELVEVLGHGSMGSVYRARDTDAGREVALKVTKLQDNPSRVERFRREGTITASLDHPGIVGVHSAGLEEGVPWIAYELVEGHTLAEAFASAELDARVQLVVEAGQALGYAHSRGVVHRDVKPANILVDTAGRVRVADFGLALALSADRMTATGAFLGTPLFMSPEQFSGKKKATPASDVWSLGVILYLALTGEVPFDGENVVELGAAIAQANPTRPSARGREVSAELEAVCLRALKANPDDRYPDGSVFAADLELALDGRSEAGADSRRRRINSLVGAALSLGLGAFAVGVAVLTREADPPPEAALTHAELGGSESNSGTETPAPVSLAGAESALAAKDLEGVADSLRSVSLSRVAPAALADFRRRALLEGQEILKAHDSQRQLERVYRIAAILGPHISEPPNPAFANAVLAQALKREHEASEALGDPKVLELVDQLSRSVLRPEPYAVYQLLDWVAVPNARRVSGRFYRTFHRLLVSVIGMEVDVLHPHAYALYGQPILKRASGLKGRYLRALVGVSAAPMEHRPEIMAAKIGAYEDLGELIEEASAELLGRRNRAFALCHFARRGAATPGHVPAAAQVALMTEALALLPDNPTVHATVAWVRLEAGLEALGLGEKEKALEQFELGVTHGVRAAELLDPKHDRVLSLGAVRLGCSRNLVALYGILGRREDAQAVIRSLPSWVTPAALAGLKTHCSEYAELRAERIDPGQ